MVYSLVVRACGLEFVNFYGMNEKLSCELYVLVQGSLLDMCSWHVNFLYMKAMKVQNLTHSFPRAKSAEE